MRRLLIAALMTGVAHSALAADMPFLRGGFSEGVVGPAVVDWQGVYIGGQAGTGRSDMNFTGTTRPMVEKLLANTTIEKEMKVSDWPLMGKESSRGNGVGGFIGYNAQWEDVVVGVELSYMNGKFGGSAVDSMGRSFTTSDGYTNNVTSEALAEMKITDIGTLRLRAGYAYGNFLPYIFGGVALGQANITRAARIHGVSVNASAPPGFQNIPFDVSEVDRKNAHLLYGYAAGLGVDISLYAGLFMRAEWEYIRFTSVIDTNVNTVRAGLGYKF
ncbi:MAG TPA: outer membrane beta-barrel protein [Xanthobacteraceae bacterium]|nr:outer membrane beta-barrel protein [Xanthobacteraceae bacterium]